jgi:isopenicillin-N epimerase
MDHTVAGLWHLDPGVAHLNHGSFGAVPLAVLAGQAAVQARIESNPERFYRDDFRADLAAARLAAASFLGCDAEGLVLVNNVTEAAACVLDAIGLREGGEIVVSDQVYPHVLSAARQAAWVCGASIRIVSPSSPSSADVVGAFVDALSPRTQLVVIDQIASASAWLLPVDDVVEAIGTRAPVFVDGAHSPGLLPSPVNPNAAFWSGNFHKWAFSARAVGALVVRPDWRDRVRPRVVSSDWDRIFAERFDYQGTTDQSARLCLAAAFAFPEQYLGMTFDQLRARNHAVLSDGVAMIEDRLAAEPEPESAAGLPLRALTFPQEMDQDTALALMHRLRGDGIATAMMSHCGRLRLRLSAQRYNDAADFTRLAKALATAL